MLSARELLTIHCIGGYTEGVMMVECGLNLIQAGVWPISLHNLITYESLFKFAHQYIDTILKEFPTQINGIGRKI